jgi:hypothetical protein
MSEQVKNAPESESQTQEPVKGNYKGGYSSKPTEGEATAHPGRGGQNIYIDEPQPATPNHPRGGGALFVKSVSESASQSEESAKGNFRGHPSKAAEGVPTAHPGRGGQNLYIDDPQPAYPNHPRGSGVLQKSDAPKPNLEPQSHNEQGLSEQQLAIVRDRIVEVIKNQSPSLEA